MRFATQIRENARVINRIRGRIQETVAHRDDGKPQFDEWKAACADFHARYDSLAFLGGVRSARERLRNGEGDAIEYALDFLEVRPYFFRSGYMYRDLMRVLRNCPLTPLQRNRYERLRVAYQHFLETRRRSGK